MAGINDDAAVWNKKWKEEVRDSASSLNFKLMRRWRLYDAATPSTRLAMAVS